MRTCVAEVAAARKALSMIKPFTRWVEDRTPSLDEAFAWMGIVGELLATADLEEEAEAEMKDALEFDVARMLPPSVLTSEVFAH